MARIIDADLFLLALIFHGSIDNEKCGWITDTVEKCRVEVFTKDEVIAILTELQTKIDMMSDSVVEGRTVTITSWKGMQKKICNIIQQKINALKGEQGENTN